MEIRAATNQDAPDIRRVVFSVLEEYDLTAEHETIDIDLRDIERDYFARGGCFEVVIDEDDKIVGTVGLYPYDHGTCELRKMYLLPAYRGKGTGKKLMDRMLAKAKALGFQHMVLETSSKLVNAIAMYRRYGFTPTQHFPTCPRCDQAYELTIESP